MLTVAGNVLDGSFEAFTPRVSLDFDLAAGRMLFASLAKGVKSGGSRTEEEQITGQYWGYDGAEKLGTPPRLYNQILRQIAASRGNDVGQNARLFALANAAMADAGIQCWHAKYLYDRWRPVVGVREANVGTGPSGLGDGNPLTDGDSYWEPLGAPRRDCIEIEQTQLYIHYICNVPYFRMMDSVPGTTMDPPAEEVTRLFNTLLPMKWALRVVGLKLSSWVIL